MEENKNENKEMNEETKNQDLDNQGNDQDLDKTDNNQDGKDQVDSGNQSIDDLPEFAQKMIKDLRAENAKHRTSNRNLETRFSQLETGMKQALGLSEEDELTPEEQIQGLAGENESLAVQNAILGLAIENGIGGDDLDYFGFLMDKELNSLEEGAELSEESFADIVKRSKRSNANMNNSSVDDDNSKDKDPEGKSDTTVEEFVKMGLAQKSKLYAERPEVYNSLFAEAKKQKLIN